MGKIWARYGQDMGEIWVRYVRGMQEIDRKGDKQRRGQTEKGTNRGGQERYQEVAGGKCQQGKVFLEICIGLMIFW